MTTALYRRYRPDTFEAVIGQEHVTEPLKAALAKNRVNHAYLFSGPRGCGKTTSARILARCLNCEKGPAPTPCGECDSCRDLAQGGPGSIDVIEIDAASHGGVDDARDLRERATFAPARDRYKIFIIDEAHMVTSAGFNALLKIVEEPPEHIKFIFATTEPDKVIGTIRSRTHHYPFRLVPPETMQNYMQELCALEGVQVEPGVLPLAIRAGAGSVRDTLSVLDQLIAGADGDSVSYERAVGLLGYTHAALLDDIIEAFAAQDSGAVFRGVDRVIQTGQDPRRFVEDLLERFRDLIIVKAVPESAAAVLRGMSTDQLERLTAQASQLGPSELSRAADVVNAALTDMTGATSPRLHLELMCARLLLPAVDEAQHSIAARLERVERRLEFDDVPVSSGGSSSGAASPRPSASAAHGTDSSASPQGGEPGTVSGAAAAREAIRASRERTGQQAEPAGGPDSRSTEPVPAASPQPTTTAPAAAAPVADASESASAHDSGQNAAQDSAQDWGGWPAVAEIGKPAQSAPAQARPAASAPAQPPADPEEAPPSLQELAQERAREAAQGGRPAEAPTLHPTTTPPEEREAHPTQPAHGASRQPTQPPAGQPAQPAPGQPTRPTTAQPAQPPRQNPVQQTSQQPARQASEQPSSADRIDMLRRAWPDILEKLKGIRRATAIFAQQSHVVDVSGNNVVVGFPQAGAERGFSAPHQENLAQAINLALGITVTVTPIHHGGGAPGPKAQAAPAARPQATREPATSGASAPAQGTTGTPAPDQAASAPRASSAPASQPAPPATSHTDPPNPAPAASGRTAMAAESQRRSEWDAREPIPEESSYFDDPYAPEDMPESTAWERVPEDSDLSFPDASVPFDDDAHSAQPSGGGRAAAPSLPPARRFKPEELDAIPAPGSATASGASTPSAPQRPAPGASAQAASALPAPAQATPAPAPVPAPAPAPGGSVADGPNSAPARSSQPAPAESLSAVERARRLAEKTASNGPGDHFGMPPAPGAPQNAPAPAASSAQVPGGQTPGGRTPEGTDGSGNPAPSGAQAPSGTTGSAGSAGQSRFKRQVAAQEAKAQRLAEKWRDAAAQPKEGQPKAEDIPSEDDEMLESSSMFGRAAIERILGGRLEEERAIDGMG